MPPVIKKPCVNNSNFSYSGKECSPLGKGYTADAEQVGTIMEGRDNTMWMVGIKNGVKVWNRVPTDLANETESIVNQEVSKNQENQPSPKKEKVVAVKKKAAAKKTEKKKPTVQVSESEESSSDSDKEDDANEKIPLSPIKETPPPTPKKTTSKKVTDKPVEKEKEKKARKPTDFNIFMSYQIKIVSEENPNMSHREKFAKVASLWKGLSDDEKKAILTKAKAVAVDKE